MKFSAPSAPSVVYLLFKQRPLWFTCNSLLRLRRAIRAIQRNPKLREAPPEIEQQSARVRRHPTRRDHVIHEPRASIRRQIVVPHAAAAGARVDDAIVARVDR